MSLHSILKQSEKVFRDNAHTILTGLGVSGTITTAYLAAKASFKAAEALRIEQKRLDSYTKSHPLEIKEQIMVVWKLYIPTAVSGVVTIGCIIGGARAGSKRTAAAYSLLSVSEKAFVEYKEKVVEQLGEKKEKVLRDEIAQDRINKNPAGLIVVGAGNVLCYEAHTGRYFNSDIETLRKAQNEINAKMIRETEATLSDFYYIIGLSPTQYSDRTGWSSCKLLELSFSTVLADDNRPCISFEYNYIEPF